MTSAKGDWQGLESEHQGPRYNSIVGLLIKWCGADASVLDIGCGSGVLHRWLTQARGLAGTYLGLEPSAMAAEEARRKNVAVVHISAETFASDRKWDCIVLSEMLYYSTDPIRLLNKYGACLQPNGVIIVSIFQKMDEPRFKRRLLHWFDARRPMTNRHCSDMVDRFFKQEKWTILSWEEIPVAGTETHWTVWAVRPPLVDSAGGVARAMDSRKPRPV